MKTKRRTLVGIAVATALTAAAATVFAHGGGYGPGYGPGPGYGGMMGGPGMMGGGHAMMGGARGMMFDDHAAYAEQRLENLRTQLDITAEQETAWTAFADTLRSQAEAMNARHQEMTGGQRQGFTEHFTRMQAGAKQMASVAEASQELYVVLTPEQQARADSLTAGGCWR